MRFSTRVLRHLRTRRDAIALLATIWAIAALELAVVWHFQRLLDKERRAQAQVAVVQAQLGDATGLPFTVAPAGVRQAEELDRAQARLRSSIEALGGTDDHGDTGVLIAHADRVFAILRQAASERRLGRFAAASRLLASAGSSGHPLAVLRHDLAAQADRARAESGAAHLRLLYALLAAIGFTFASISVIFLRSARHRMRSEGLAAENGDLLARSRLEEARYRDLFENAAEPIATVTLDWTITAINTAFASALGYTRDELIGRQVTEFMSPEARASAAERRALKLSGKQKRSTYEQEFFGRDGRMVVFEVSSRLIEQDGEPVGIQAICRDVTARRAAETELRELAAASEHQALHDPVTGLPNRRLFRQRIEASLRRSRRPDEGFAVLIIDLDDFKQVNDALGHHSGDLLLVEAARHLAQAVRPQDTVARLGGDEFGIIVEEVVLSQPARSQFVARIQAALLREIELRGVPVSVSGSIGVALAPTHGTTAEELLQHADQAMYTAKQKRRGFLTYDPASHQADIVALRLLGELRQAIEHDQLDLHYQPIIDLRSGRAARFEALLRWPHPTRGPIGPADFIPAAERTHLITPLSRWVLNRAMAQSKSWEQHGFALPVAVNLSTSNLDEIGLVESLAELLAKHNLAASRVLVEVTESAMIVDPVHTEHVLRELSALGVHIVIDDFGAGYTSLAYLSSLPINKVKIDRSFIEALPVDRSALAIVRSVIELAHELGLETIGEGVEHPAELDILLDLGCDHVQGNYFSPPLSADSLVDWLHAQDAGTPRTYAAAIRGHARRSPVAPSRRLKKLPAS